MAEGRQLQAVISEQISGTKWYRSLQFVVLVMLLTLATVLVIITSFVMNTTGKVEFARQSNRELEERGKLVVTTLGQTITQVESLTRSLASLGATLPADPALFKQLVPELMGDEDQTSILAGGGIWPEPFSFDPARERRSFFWGRESSGKLRYYDDYNNPDGDPYFAEEWYVPATLLQAGQVYWSRSYMDPYSFEPMSTCTVPYFRNGELAGVATVDVMLLGLKEFFDEQVTTEMGYLFSVDRNNRFLTYPMVDLARNIERDANGHLIQEFKTVRELTEPVPGFLPLAEHLQDLTAADLRKRTAEMPIEFEEMTTRILAGTDKIASDEAKLIVANFLDRHHTQDGQISAIPVPDDHILGGACTARIFHVGSTHWKVVLVTSNVAVDVPVQALTERIFLLLLVPLLGLVILAAFFVRQRFTQPISRMTRRLQKQSGHDSEVLATLPVETRDEIGELALWFNRRTKALEEARTQAEQLARSKSAFLANMSHEIRTPMNGILGAANLLEDLASPEEQQKVDLIRESAESLMVVLNDILDYSKMESGEFRIQEKQFDLAGTIHGCRQLVQNLADEKGLELEFHNGLGRSTYFMGDPCRFRQIILNLLTNAIKFTFEGSVKVDLSWLGGPPNGNTGEGVAIEIQDTGIGIAEGDLEDIFEIFQQAESSLVHHAGGTGLGLAISRNLARLMGGDIAVTSQEGIGTSFRVTLPLAHVARPTLVGQEENAAPVEMGLKVLLVEDNPINRFVANEILVRMGCRVESAEDGHEALELATNRDYDIVLMDLQLPKLDGFQVTERIRLLPGSRGQVPIVALTANAMDDDRERCRKAGMTGFVSKPFKQKELARALVNLAVPQPVP